MDRGRADVPLGTGIASQENLAGALRQLRRRHARQHGDSALTYRELAARSGYAHGVIGDYFSGKVLAPTDRLDVLVVLLGATGEEQAAFATARDRIEEHRRRPATAPSALCTPRQLPGTVRHFSGRAAELEALAGLAEEAAGPGGAALIAAIDGPAGVGKTALAVYGAQQVAYLFPDGQLHVNLRGFDPLGEPMNPAEAIRGFLEALGVPAGRIPATLEAQCGLYRSLLADQRILVVLDNARDTEQVRPMLPGSPTCLTVVTSRSRLAGLAAQGACPLTLDVLTIQECRGLLASHVNASRAAAEPQAIDDLIGLCARLPLALTITAARAAAHPTFPLAALTAELENAGSRLDALVSADTASNMRAVLSWSYRSLGAPAARMFRLLGIHPGPDVSLRATASLADLTLQQARLALTELSDAHLVEEHAPGRFAFHDLLRAFADEQARIPENDGECRAAIHRALDHYLHTGYSADRLVDPHREPITLAPACPGAAPEDLTDDEQAIAWFEAEHKVLLATITQAASGGFDRHAWQIPWTLADFFDRKGHWPDWAATHEIALAAARRLADPRAEARIHRGIGNACTRLGSYGNACTHMTCALDLCAQLGDLAGQAHCHLDLGWIFEQQARYEDALSQARQALDLYCELGHRPGEAWALSSVGWCHGLLGDQQQALTYNQRALALNRDLGDRQGEATTWDNLGFAHHHLGDYAQAIACYQQALSLHAKSGDRHDEAGTLTRLGDTYRSLADHDGARDSWEKALTILDDLHHPDSAELRARLRLPDPGGTATA